MPERNLAGIVLGDFVLREKIGEGGHGAVYRCEQPLLNRTAVVKVLRESRRQSGISRERFIREAQLASQLDHHYAAHVYAFGVDQTEGGLLWIAMEHVQGVTLAQWIEQHGPLPLGQFASLFEKIAEVVSCAHGRGIVHRDLKLSNIMIVERNGQLIPKLLDFGIAKVVPERGVGAPSLWPEGSLAETIDRGGRSERYDGSLTPTGACLGSLAYMAPEQWRASKTVGPAADIYALGIVAFRVLTKRAPFVADCEVAYYRAHNYSEVPHSAARCPSSSTTSYDVRSRRDQQIVTRTFSSLLPISAPFCALAKKNSSVYLRSNGRIKRTRRACSGALTS